MSNRVQAQITKIKNVIFYVLGFTMACDIHWAAPVIIGFALCWLAEGGLKRKLSVFLHNKYALLFASLYLLHLIGMLYSTNMAFGWFDLQVKLSILIFPILLVSEGEMDFKKQKLFVNLFVLGLILNGIVCVVYAIWRYLVLDTYIFQYMAFSLFMHPSYYSMYIDMALVLMLNVLGTRNVKIGLWEKIFLYTSIFFLEFILVLLQSKMGLIISVAIFLAVLVRYVVRTKSWYAGLAILIVTVVLSVITYRYMITSNRSRILSAKNILESGHMDVHSTESTQVRHFIWLSAWKIIKTAPIAGVGTGDVKDALMQQYLKDDVTGAYRERLNAHDEYFQITVALGVIGLLCLLSCLFVPLYKSIREQRFVYIMFLIIMMSNFIPEAMLETQGGTIFYGFFNSLLMFNFVI